MGMKNIPMCLTCSHLAFPSTPSPAWLLWAFADPKCTIFSLSLDRCRGETLACGLLLPALLNLANCHSFSQLRQDDLQGAWKASCCSCPHHCGVCHFFHWCWPQVLLTVSRFVHLHVCVCMRAWTEGMSAGPTGWRATACQEKKHSWAHHMCTRLSPPPQHSAWHRTATPLSAPRMAWRAGQKEPCAMQHLGGHA